LAEETSPLDQAVQQALELLVYAPVGLALSARDELPKLVAKGRERVTGQLAMAKLIGQFATTQGQREVRQRAGRIVEHAGEAADRLAGRSPSSSTATRPPAPPASPPAPKAPATAARPAPGKGRSRMAPSNGAQSGAAAGAAAAASSAVGVPSVADLAIPGYDTLSASQVVQRLGGLSAPELEAVHRYENAMRGRRTILSKVAQLQAEPSGRS
jgi:hypothetical protein